ncbi:hypothetical protein [Saccharothrix luteola]|uniref:hypothetical protein n=1 Tax=Saccharothrix luteola TaxID=2893018 RepID=UPI001E3A4B89|nr:hypothetical protein [Saccharothrix luteola]MCC8242799.1 hypothetical protein [Saccharothrix luteola]
MTTETLIDLGARAGMCADVEDHVAVDGPCDPGEGPVADAVTDPEFRAEVIAAWSMEGFTPTTVHRPEMLADVVDKAGRQNESCMETITTRQGGAVAELAKRVTFSEDFAAMHRQVLAEGVLSRILTEARADTDRDEADNRELLGCDTPDASPGCDLTLRYLHQVGRNNEPNVVHRHGLRLRVGRGRQPQLPAAHADAGLPVRHLPQGPHHAARRRTDPRTGSGTTGRADLPHPRSRDGRSRRANRPRRRHRGTSRTGRS